MRTRTRTEFLMNLDSLLDTMTNGVGILIVVLAVTHVSVGDSARKAAATEHPIEISQDELAAALEKLADLQAILDELRRQWESVKVFDAQSVEQQVSDLRRLIAELESLAKLPLDGMDRAKVEAAIEEETRRLAELERNLREADEQRAARESELAKLTQADEERTLTVPVLQEIEGEVDIGNYVCRGGRVIPVDSATLSRSLDTGLRAALNVPVGKMDLNAENGKKLVEYFDRHDVGDTTIRFTIAGNYPILVAKMVPRDTAQGETASEIRHSGSDFALALRGFERRQGSKRFLIHFFVWGDSFETYLAARKLVDEFGILANWSAYAPDESPQFILGLGTSGRPQGQ